MLILKDKGEKLQICAIWVDDFIFASSSKHKWESLLADLRKHFNVTGGELKQFLGLEIFRDRENRRMSVSQENTINSFLDKINMQDANSASVPCTSGFVFSKTDCPSEEKKQAFESSGQGPTPFR